MLITTILRFTTGGTILMIKRASREVAGEEYLTDVAGEIDGRC